MNGASDSLERKILPWCNKKSVWAYGLPDYCKRCHRK